jgi:3-oxo-5alpha-steroid 4-dehydrogenase
VFLSRQLDKLLTSSISMFKRLLAACRRLASGEAESYPPRVMTATEVAQQRWDYETDVAVVGFGGAGAAAAIEARDNGADVLVMDRFRGGGSTRISGGIYYAGAGTAIQQAAGVEDSPENMYNYLQQEVRDAVSAQTLREFCEQSPENFDWLVAQGVPFEASPCPFKTSYPSNLYYFYYSGNESFPPYSEQAKPAARGHRAHGRGVSGAALFVPLRASALRKGIKLLEQHKAVRLIADDTGKVIGVEVKAMRPGTLSGWLHRQLSALMVFLRYVTIFTPFVNYGMRGCIEALENHYSVLTRVFARQAVVISSGGFYFNRTMVRQYAPEYLDGVPLGTIADNGSGIKLGESVGGQTGLMDNISAWRFINPPEAFVRGILVDQKGNRICNEMLYGAQLAERIMKQAGGKAWLVIDHALFRQAHREMGPSRAMWFQSVSALMFLYLARSRGASLDQLASKLGMPAEALARTVGDYNNLALAGGRDAMGKPAEFCTALGEGPYYALDCSADSLMMCPALSLGGLKVEEASGRVLSSANTPIDGLYAAGRSAVGVASRSYVSGLSIADCIFSGRRAGRHAALRSNPRDA